MTKHYFEATALPELVFEEEPEITFRQLMIHFKMNLKGEELAQVAVVRRLIDIDNLPAFCREEELDHRGGLTVQDFEEREGMPPYMVDFLEEEEEPMRAHGRLLVEFFRHEIPQAKGFMRQWLIFERQWRLVMVGFRAKQLGRDPAVELQWEDPDDELVAQIVAQRDADHYEPPEGFEVLKGVEKEEPMALHKRVSRFRFDRVDAMLEDELFSIGYLLGYMAQLMILEDLK